MNYSRKHEDGVERKVLLVRNCEEYSIFFNLQ